MRFDLVGGDCLEALKGIPSETVDAVVTDPPYELGFMGKAWDASGIAYSVELWRECLRVLKPGGHLLAFSGSRTYHRMASAIEDAEFEIRDQIMWIYGSGFPKSLDVSKAIDKAAGAEREVISQCKRTGKDAGTYGAMMGDNFITAPATEAAKAWDGWGTALKPAHEPICVARKPLCGTVAANVLAHGVGGLNIDGCRVGEEVRHASFTSFKACHGNGLGRPGTAEARRGTQGDPKEYVGRWPANVIMDEEAGEGKEWSRFFYCPKASRSERGEFNNHPTVKPIDLMRYLVRLVSPVCSVVLDPFMGSGTTGVACALESREFIGIEREPEYLAIANKRIAEAFDQYRLEVA